MPYIEQKSRDAIDIHIEKLTGAISSDGDLNYAITMLLHYEVRKRGLSYGSLNALMGVLTCASNEFNRKVVTPYEESKILQNGDIKLPFREGQKEEVTGLMLEIGCCYVAYINDNLSLIEVLDGDDLMFHNEDETGWRMRLSTLRNDIEWRKVFDVNGEPCEDLGP